MKAEVAGGDVPEDARPLMDKKMRVGGTSRVSRQITGLHQVLKALDALSIEPMCQLQGCYAW